MSAKMSTGKSLEAADYAVFGTLTVAGYLVGLYFSIPRKPCYGAVEPTLSFLRASVPGRQCPGLWHFSLRAKQ
ncbi:hypothetical protein HPB50_020802 [Hyalomma asiaticum]|uniref:Uncharacterized protein n=1 Tax=Hyalomma asiaticum TaxID=266040 RepID=A0ACB7T969_HYAAI|nr:hypothetical protein HPB50_020802 [Hyalomma asiaticum]